MPDEATHITYLVRLSTLVIGIIVATHTLLETARDTLFLERIPVGELPWMYLGVAALSVLLAFAPPMKGANRWAALPLLLLGASVGTFVFWLLSRSPTHSLYYVLYIWTALCGATVVTQFWTTMARIFTLGEAKRLFATIAIGAVVGSAVGAGVARLLFMYTTAHALVLVAAVGFALSAGASVLLRPLPSAGTVKAPKPLAGGEMPAARVVWKSAYLLAVGELAVVTALTVTVVDYAFKRALVRHFGPTEIGPIVSTVAFASNFAGGVIQIFFVPRILAAVGTARSLRLLPAILTAGAFAGLLMPYSFVAVGLRAIDGILRYSLQRTATELLFVPISEAIRGRVKTLLDVVTQRGGQAVASLALLAVPATMHTRYLVLSIAICSGVWFWSAVRVRPRYLSLFRSMVQEGALTALESMPALDQAGVEVLVAALSNDRDEQVIFALDVLEERGKAKLIPTLILFHPSPKVVIRALEIFAARDRRDTAHLAWRLVSHADPAVRIQALHTVCALDFKAEKVRALVSSDDSLLAATALVELWARGVEREEEVSRVNELLSPSGDPLAQRALLRALATTHSRRLLVAALPLAERATIDVQVEIAGAVEADPMVEAIPVLLSMLAHWPTREPARRAMVAIGQPALNELLRVVRDTTKPSVIRMHVPRSISRFAPDVAVPLLLDLVLHHPEGIVRYKALRGLGRLATDGAVVKLDEASLLRVVDRDVALGSQTLAWVQRLAHAEEPRTPHAKSALGLLHDLIREKGGHAVERVFRVIALRYRGENWEQIFDGFRGGRWDASRELVEGTLREPLRGRILELIDRAADRRRLSRPTRHDEPLAPLLAELVGAEDRVLSSVAAYYAQTMSLVLPPPSSHHEEAAGAVRSPAR